MRESQRKNKIRAILGKAEKRSNRRKYTCMYPGCESNAIQSHSQQRACQLEAISEDGNVYTLQRNMYQSVKEGGDDPFTSVSIRIASRFKGYCSSHDTSIFLPIENGRLNVKEPEHNFLLMLRAFSFEMANKRGMHDYLRYLVRKIEPLVDGRATEDMELQIQGIEWFLHKDAPSLRQRLFELHSSQDWSAINFNAFEIDRNLGTSSTTCFSPLGEAHNEWTNDHFEERQPVVFLSVVPGASKTDISFSWLSQIDALCGDFLGLNASDAEFGAVLNKYILCESEDACIRPSLWDNKTTAEKGEILRHMGNAVSQATAMQAPMIIDW